MRQVRIPKQVSQQLDNFLAAVAAEAGKHGAECVTTSVSGAGAGAKPAARIVLYDEPLVEGVPTQIWPFKEGNSYRIANLKVTGQGKVTLDLEKKVKGECTVVLLFRADKQFLIVNLDSEREQTFHSSGAVLFGLSSEAGHRISPSVNNGKLSFEVQYRVSRRYDMPRQEGDLYAFAVKGRVYSNSVVPGEQKDNTAYLTSFNVVKTRFKFE
jgi:hypothetical protein